MSGKSVKILDFFIAILIMSHNLWRLLCRIFRISIVFSYFFNENYLIWTTEIWKTAIFYFCWPFCIHIKFWQIIEKNSYPCYVEIEAITWICSKVRFIFGYQNLVAGVSMKSLINFIFIRKFQWNSLLRLIP